MTRIEPMTVAEYAAFVQAMGEWVMERSGVFWRRVRPGFYRPLIPFQTLPSKGLQPPRAAFWSGYQHAVPEGSPDANSTLTVIMFPNAAAYGLEVLEKKRRWEVRTAARQFVVKRLTGAEQLARAGHPVYVEFQRRTGYCYRVDRLKPERFAAWAEDVFRFPKAWVLGAFRGGQLEAVAICQAVERTLFYATFFARLEALKQHVGSLLLHEARSLAAASGLDQVYVGLRKSGIEAGVDDFYLQRGAQYVPIPARYWLNPVAAILLRCFGRKALARIRGATTPLAPVATVPTFTASARAVRTG